MDIYSKRMFRYGYKNLDCLKIYGGTYFTLNEIDFTLGMDTVEINIAFFDPNNLNDVPNIPNVVPKDPLLFSYDILYEGTTKHLIEVNYKEVDNTTGVEFKIGDSVGDTGVCALSYDENNYSKQFKPHKVGIDNCKTLAGWGNRYCYVNNSDNTTILHGGCYDGDFSKYDKYAEVEAGTVKLSGGTFNLFGSFDEEGEQTVNNSKFIGKLYGFIVKQEDETIYNLVPAQRYADGAYGLLNKETNKFYKAQG